MKVFVTGATGVLGRPVVAALRERGVDVACLARSEENRRSIAEMGASPIDAEITDAGALRAALEGREAVLHLATRIPPAEERKKPDAWAENDRIRDAGTAALVSAALAVGSVRTFVYPSVTFMYADGGDDWLTAETATLAPPAMLESTLTAERHVAAFAEAAEGNRGVVLRFGAFYGPASPDSAAMLEMARKGVMVPLAPMAAYRSFIWIDDAAAAVLAALKRAETGVYDVVEDRPSTQAESIAAMAAAVGRRRLWTLPRALLRLKASAGARALLARSQRVSAARFRESTGWAPEVPDQAEGWRRMAAATPR